MRLVSIGVKGQRDLSWPPAFRSLAASIQDRMAADNLRLLGSVAAAKPFRASRTSISSLSAAQMFQIIWAAERTCSAGRIQ